MGNIQRRVEDTDLSWDGKVNLGRSLRDVVYLYVTLGKVVFPVNLEDGALEGLVTCQID